MRLTFQLEFDWWPQWRIPQRWHPGSLTAVPSAPWPGWEEVKKELRVTTPEPCPGETEQVKGRWAFHLNGPQMQRAQKNTPEPDPFVCLPTSTFKQMFFAIFTAGWTWTYVGVRDIILMPMYFFFWTVWPEGGKQIKLLKPFMLLTCLEDFTEQSYTNEPLACLSCDSARNCRILSEGMAKEIPAVTFSVLMPITSPSCR